jgi:hypothetical protein
MSEHNIRKPDMQHYANENQNANDYRIHLNFIPLSEPMPKFAVYRKKQESPQEPRPQPEIMAYRLPATSGAEDQWPLYWISFDEIENYERFEAQLYDNPYLTCWILYRALITSAENKIPPDQFHISDNRFSREISFVQRTHDEGHEQLEVEPYYLHSTRQFGYLVDFHFRKREGVPFSRKIQQLSLSLDRSYRRNLDYYVDRDSRLSTFLAELNEVFAAIRMPGTDKVIRLSNNFVSLPADRLRTKNYMFANRKISRSQFVGLREFGPLLPLEDPPRLLFIFREQDRHAARLLARGLKGTSQRGRYAFPGFLELFKCDLEIDSNPVVLPNLERKEMESALNQVKTVKESHPNTLPVLVLPADDNAYLTHKALFSCAEIPTQVCTLRVLQNEGSLKWAIANLALQVFCKAGGFPWKVQPMDTESSLIIGISQSHKVRKIDEKNQVEKYFAFSVMTDSSGLFQKIQVLSESNEEESYLQQLRQNLQEVLAENANGFSQAIIHTSFRLKHSEIDTIQKTVEGAASSSDLANCRFAVVKVNHKTRFFGVNRSVNSLVPFEATRVSLGSGEYLVWFEGIFPDKTTVTKAYPGPTHLKILRISNEESISHRKLLQDLVNLSGANWRGFNAKSAPVSVFYCHLVADMVRNFHERDLPLPAVSDIRPWFI